LISLKNNKKIQIKKLLIASLLSTHLIFCSSQKESSKPNSSLKFSIQIKKMDGGTWQHISTLRDDKTGRFMKRIAQIKPSNEDMGTLVESDMETNLDAHAQLEWFNQLQLLEMGQLYSALNRKLSSSLKFTGFSHEGTTLQLPDKKEDGKNE
jgi:hypothetical protein